MNERPSSRMVGINDATVDPWRARAIRWILDGNIHEIFTLKRTLCSTLQQVHDFASFPSVYATIMLTNKNECPAILVFFSDRFQLDIDAALYIGPIKFQKRDPCAYVRFHPNVRSQQWSSLGVSVVESSAN